MQNKKNNVVVFSRPVRSGKTTELFRFIAGKKDVGGFLTPDGDGKRILYDIGDQASHPFEAEEGSPHPVTIIGKFRFYARAFDKAKKLFDHRAVCDFFIIDEVGKLEIIQDAGLEPELTPFINRYRHGERKGTLLLVVRDTLTEAALRKYGLSDARIIHSMAEL